jgi:hypothetical protein
MLAPMRIGTRLKSWAKCIKRDGALAVASAAALLAAAPSHADVYAFSWGFRWASGQILHDADVADSDPSANREVYADSILGYDLIGLREVDFSFPTLRGAGGSIVVDRAADGSGALHTITFVFGPAVPGSSDIYQLVAALDPALSFGPYPTDQPWEAELAGNVFRGDEQDFLAMTPGYLTRHEAVAAAVPEPASGVLWGLGLAGIALWRHRRPG